MFNASKLTNLITEGDASYIDLSTATEFVNSARKGCLTLIVTSNSVRTKLSNDLYADLGSPEAVQVLMTANNVIFIPASANAKAYTIGKDNLVYNTPLAKRIAEISGTDITERGSMQIGTYHMQQADADTLAAVVSFS